MPFQVTKNNFQGQERRPGMHKAFTLGSSDDGVFGALNIDREYK